MTDIETYQAAVLACVAARNVLRQHDLPKLLAAIEHSDAFGPLLDPTAWIRNGEKMRQDRDLMKAALALRNWNPAPRPEEG